MKTNTEQIIEILNQTIEECLTDNGCDLKEKAKQINSLYQQEVSAVDWLRERGLHTSAMVKGLNGAPTKFLNVALLLEQFTSHSNNADPCKCGEVSADDQSKSTNK